MARAKEAFLEVKTIHDIKEIFKDNIRYLTNGYFNPELLEYTINCLDNLTEEKQNYLFALIHETDKKMNHPYQANYGLYHKIPAILSSIIYINNHYEQVKKYKPYELATLSKFSVLKTIPEYEEALVQYTPKIMKRILKKSTDFSAHYNILTVVENMLDNNKTEEEIIEYIKNTDYEIIRNESEKIIEEIKKSLGVII